MIRSLRSAVMAPLVIAIAATAMAGAVSAFPLSACTLTATSIDAGGQTIDTAQSGEADATQSEPFEVAWDGAVDYESSTEVPIRDFTYGFALFGIPTPIGGREANPDGDTERTARIEIDADAPFRIAGLYHVSGTLVGEGGRCEGSGWILVRGDPAGTVPWALGIVLVALGVAGLYAGARGRLLVSVLGGIALGVGLDLLLVSYGVLPFAELTPLIVLVLAIVGGLAVGAVGRTWRDRRARVPLED